MLIADHRPHLPTWQSFPVAPNTAYTYGWDWLSITFNEAPLAFLDRHEVVFSAPYMIPTPGNKEKEAETAAWGEYFQRFNGPNDDPIEPVSDFFYPIVDRVDRVHVAGAENYNPADNRIVGVYGASVYWRSIFQETLPKDSTGIVVVVENDCSDPFSYEILGPSIRYLGVGDKHDKKYDGQDKSKKLHELAESGSNGLSGLYSGAPVHKDYCPFSIRVYPSDAMRNRFVSVKPIVFTFAAVAIFGFTALVFHLFSLKVEERQQSILSTATRTSAIVSSLFPSDVRDQHYPLPNTEPKNKRSSFQSGLLGRNTQSGDHQHESDIKQGLTANPIACLYPNTTVLFADICGFTAWASVRQPAQVFSLLETLYGAFDGIARQHGVFKVETIGDSYVAVAGLPTPRKHHAVVMARFASDCRRQMRELVLELEKTLGPGTADLAMRFGLNSGPTTGGVLRGEKARFQLFGDTVNTAARMESNGERDRIQVSQKTAELIRLAGKGSWLMERNEKINCKGKGLLTTFWCEPHASAGTIVALSATPRVTTTLGGPIGSAIDEGVALDRLIDWNVDMFAELLKDIMAHRASRWHKQSRAMSFEFAAIGKAHKPGRSPLDEVVECISLAADGSASMHRGRSGSAASSDSIQLEPIVMQQLQALATQIAKLYQDNPFHNFDHCSHVVMSTKKLLDRISEHCKDVKALSSSAASGASNISNGIVHDPLTQFAIVFAALIHDVDHPGVSNAQLVSEQHPLAVAYAGKSVAEQRSVDLGWNQLMQAQFAELRNCMFANETEFVRFRQIVVNIVLATDLFDDNLKAMREQRWTKSFSGPSGLQTDNGNIHHNVKLAVNNTSNSNHRRATIVMELIIQASDVSHTMQHFTVYQKWNLRLLTEMHQAYTSGRTTKDPLDGCYEGELWFFDNYVIPLGQKLRECGVFGVSCDEFLDYARDNCMEWETKGRDIVREAVDALRHCHPTVDTGDQLEI